MSKSFVTGKGNPVQLGAELGKGGEGSVFEVAHQAELVAKLYHKAPDSKKQAKLRFMAAHGNAKLLSYTAWPQETLHQKSGGPVVGFLMPKVTGREPIHMLYSPAYRRQRYPKASWEFLIWAARNTAAAFETLHMNGHVLGDVNQGNVMVGHDSKVTLIDCDSFQVDAAGTLHLCEVGVSHFTPPELQGLSSFDGVKRTFNHDNFGLALLLFHVLFGGRHPYAGVPLRKDVGEALETDIQHLRYAYAKDAALRGSKPPPTSIPLEMMPTPIVSMFDAAFTEPGRNNGRPAARHWVTALDGLRSQLQRCRVVPTMHLYPAKTQACPWCALETKGIVYFVDLSVTFSRAASGFVLAQVWAHIESVPLPSPAKIPQVIPGSRTPSPLPPNIPSRHASVVTRVLVIVATIGLLVAFPSWALVVLIAGAIGLWKGGGRGEQERKVEKGRRKQAADAAEKIYDQLAEQLRQGTGPDAFAAKKRALASARKQYEELPGLEKTELDQLHSGARDRQRRRFLESCFIDSATIKGVGPGAKAALRSFGIETAADVTRHAVMAVKGFGQVKTRAVMDWQQACERKFVFDAKVAVSDADKNAVRSKFAVRTRSIEAALQAGMGELRDLSRESARVATVLLPRVQDAADDLAQAKADLTVF